MLIPVRQHDPEGRKPIYLVSVHPTMFVAGAALLVIFALPFVQIIRRWFAP